MVANVSFAKVGQELSLESVVSAYIPQSLRLSGLGLHFLQNDLSKIMTGFDRIDAWKNPAQCGIENQFKMEGEQIGRMEGETGVRRNLQERPD